VKVTADSSDTEIIAAINEAGHLRLPWREHDWPEPEEKGGKAWVIPSDIGASRRGNRSLMGRLKKMVTTGILKRRYLTIVVVVTRRAFEKRTLRRGSPRFRVANR